MSASSPAFKVFGYGMAPEAPEHQPYNDQDIRDILAEHATRLKRLESMTAELEESLHQPTPPPKTAPQVLAERFAQLRADPVQNNFEADELKLCAEFAAYAAEGDHDAIQALTPIAEAQGVSVEAFVKQELGREAARRSRVIKLRAAQITFERRIEAASGLDDLTKIIADIEAFTV